MTSGLTAAWMDDRILPSENWGGAQLDERRSGMPQATTRQNPSSPWYGSVRDKDRVTEEPCAVKVACTDLKPSGAGDRFA
jgi:hypothetical protein